MLKLEITQKVKVADNLKQDLEKTERAKVSAVKLAYYLIFYGDVKIDNKKLEFIKQEYDKTQYTPKPDEITSATMIKWFLDNYKDPADGVPYDEGEYVYHNGGPYDPIEELEYHFPDADPEEIEKAVQHLYDQTGDEWVKNWEY